MSDVEKLKKGLSRYLPERSINGIAIYLAKHPIQLIISKPRLTKLGDYRPPYKKPYHIISINCDLNKYHFLWTLIHEIAHYEVYRTYKNSVKPHGVEWQNAFSFLAKPFIERNIFPEKLKPVLLNHMERPTASSCSDPSIYKAFTSLNAHHSTFLDELPEDAVFAFGNKVFSKGEKLRTRYLCTEISSNKKYYVNGVAEVELLQHANEDID